MTEDARIFTIALGAYVLGAVFLVLLFVAGAHRAAVMSAGFGYLSQVAQVVSEKVGLAFMAASVVCGAVGAGVVVLGGF